MASSLQSTSIALAALLLFPSVLAATPTYKCETNGSVQYQQTPCPSKELRKPPTVGELNTERRKRLAVPKESAPLVTSPQAAPTSQCDGRTMCSQMTSCAEAKYFLAHCPGVKMDGNHDGVPCEMQWCTR
jgi:hypothetical protein